MGDRVCIRFHDKYGDSPVIYLHWSGHSALGVLADFFESRSFTERKGDVSYNCARLIGMWHERLDGSAGDGHGLGVHCTSHNAVAWLNDNDCSPGDAGCVLVDYEHSCIRVSNGYLARDWDERTRSDKARLAALGFPVVTWVPGPMFHPVTA